MFGKILIANRGEIAVRIGRACRELGVRSVAVFSDADRWALHTRCTDESYYLGPSPASDSYLRSDLLIAAARASRAEAIHPGYGFLAENPEFAMACRKAGIVFIGPSPEAMRLLGDKAAAKKLARDLGVPVVPGYDGANQDLADLHAAAEEVGFPLLIKATAGGGGRGMRLVRSRADFEAALESARREAQAAFGDAAVLLERAVSNPRHVEFQILADHHGNIVHLGERDCSVQRKHQKVIEESPSPAMSPALRTEMGAAAVSVARAAGYQNAGTVEFLLTEEGSYYFLEVNTRLQVEHPVTEQVTGLDLVREQLRVAAGEPLAWRQEDVHLLGHAIECRVYAEDPARDYAASTGILTAFAPPAGEGIRNDLGVETGDEVTPFYDSMIAKLIVSAPDRATCVQRAVAAVREYRVEGVATNLDLLRSVLATPAFRLGDLSTDYLDQVPSLRASPTPLPEHALLAAASWRLCMTASPLGSPWHGGPWRQASEGIRLRFRDSSLTARRVSADSWLIALPHGDHEVQCKRGGSGSLLVREGIRLWTVEGSETAAGWRLIVNGEPFAVARSASPLMDGRPSGEAASLGTGLRAPMTGKLVKISAAEGETVTAGQTVVIIEAMKMEHSVSAPRDGKIARMHYRVGDVVQAGASLAEME